MADFFSKNHENDYVYKTFQEYKDNPILQLSHEWKYMTFKDRIVVEDMIYHFFNIGKNNSRYLSFEECLNNIMDLAENFSKYSHNLAGVKADFYPGDNVDCIQVNFDLYEKPNYLFYGLYSSFLYPNTHFLGYNYSKYPKSSLFKYFDKTQLKISYDWAIGEK